MSAMSDGKIPASELHRLRHQLDDLAMKHEHDQEAMEDFSKMSVRVSNLIKEHTND